MDFSLWGSMANVHLCDLSIHGSYWFRITKLLTHFGIFCFKYLMRVKQSQSRTATLLQAFVLVESLKRSCFNQTLPEIRCNLSRIFSKIGLISWRATCHQQPIAVQLAASFCPQVCLRLPFAMLLAIIFAAAFASEYSCHARCHWLCQRPCHCHQSLPS